MKNLIVKDFPLPRIQCGAPLGNSYLGVLVWGSGCHLNLTLGSNTLWDHRGGLPWSEKMSFSNIRKALESKDLPGLKEIFAYPGQPPRSPRRPQIVPMGRIELDLTPGCELLRYELNLENGLLRIVYDKNGKEQNAEFLIGRKDTRCAAFRCGDIARLKLVDSWHLSEGLLDDNGFEAPSKIGAFPVQGFRQIMPCDPDFALAFRQDDDLVSICFARGDEQIAALPELKALDWNALAGENRLWWKEYWNTIPTVELGNPDLEELYSFGLYKFGSMSDPGGIPAGLQGPWIEDNTFPPWSADYHFNINVQMCYGPALRANRFQNLKPLFDMVREWVPKLRQNAEFFAGVKEGIMLPHAVDDRGTCMGGFWTGAIDHASSAWTAQMMFDYCDYSGDMAFLRGFLFDFMKGIMRVYTAMMDEKDGKLRLPVTVSPEYGACGFDAWGVNASFQLAAVHRLAKNLIQAAKWLNEPVEPLWEDIEKRLPQATLILGGPAEFLDTTKPELALWEGRYLEYSHRHHSHLAGICPFNTIDPQSPEFRDVVDASRRRWIADGMGDWSGWSIAWAAQLDSHFHQGDDAELRLEIFHRFFTNCGGGTLHDADHKGFSILGDGTRGEIMQIDGAMGAISAIQEMLLFDCAGVLHIGEGIPDTWKSCCFADMPAPGGFRVSAQFKRGRGSALKVRAVRDGVFKMRLDPVRGWKTPAKGTVQGEVWSVALKAGESAEI